MSRHLLRETSSIGFSPTGIPYLIPNRVSAHSPDFYISYNSRDAEIYGCVPTAVVLGQMQRFYVLNGNHESELAGKPFDECLEYLHAHAAELNKYSEALPPRGSTVESVLAAPR